MLYAAHGSNLHPARLALRLPGSKFEGTGTVAGRRLRFHKRSVDQSGKCNIATGTGRVHVAVYQLSETEKARLDEIEGAGQGYTAESIEVPGFGECFTYIAELSHIDDGLRPYSWYKGLVLAGCEVLDFPADYTAWVRNIEATEDPNIERHASNMKIVKFVRDSTDALTLRRRSRP